MFEEGKGGKDAEAEHADADGDQQEHHDLGDGFDDIFTEESADAIGIGKGESYDEEVDDEGQKCDDVSCMIDQEEQDADGGRSDDERDAQRNDTEIVNRFSQVFFFAEQVHDPHEQEYESAGDFKIADRYAKDVE